MCDCLVGRRSIDIVVPDVQSGRVHRKHDRNCSHGRFDPASHSTQLQVDNGEYYAVPRFAENQLLHISCFQFVKSIISDTSVAFWDEMRSCAIA